MNHKDTINKMNEERRVNKLNRKYGAKTYFEKYLPLYYSSIGSSWMFNFISGLGVSALVFFFFSSLIPFLVVVVTVTFILVALWELAKRYLIINLFEDYYMEQTWNKGHIVIIFLLAGGSIAGTFFGSKELIPKVLPEAQLISFSEESKFLDEKLKTVEAELEDLRTNKKYQTSEGIIRHNISQFTIPKLVTKRDSIDSKLMLLKEKITAKNGDIGKDYEAITQLKAWHYSCFAAISDLLLIFCLWYKEKYEYIEYLERGDDKKKQTTKASSATPTHKRNNITNKRNATSATNEGATIGATSATPAVAGAQHAGRATDATPKAQRATNPEKKVKAYGEMTIDELLEKLKGAQSSYRQYKSRFNKGEKGGKVKTNEAGMTRWKGRIEQIKAELERKREKSNK